MKIDADRAALAAAAKWIVKIIGRPVIPILAGVVIEATPDEVMLSAFNYEVSVRAHQVADVGEPGRILVPALPLATFLATVRGDRVTLETDGSTLTVRCGSAKASIQLMAVEDYPALPDLSTFTALGELPEGFADAAGRLEPLSDSRDHRPWATALKVATADGQMTMMIATPYNLGRIGMATSLELPDPWLVPAASLVGVLHELSGQIIASVSNGVLALESGTRSVTIRLLDTDYPRVDPLLNTIHGTRANLARADLAGLVRLVAGSGEHARLSFDRESLTVATHRGHNDEVTSLVSDSVACSCTDVGSILVTIPLLRAVLAATSSEQLEMQLVLGAGKPAVLVDGPDARFVFMSLNFTEET